MKIERLNELMRVHYPFISYEQEDAIEWLGYKHKEENDEMMAWYFADYLMSQELCEVEE